MTDVPLKDLFDIYQKQNDSVHKLWAYFQVVSLAVLGYTVGSDKSDWSYSTYVLIALSYIFFAVANQIAIVFSQRELEKFGKAVESAAAASGPIGKTISVEAIKWWKVALFHTVALCFVGGAIAMTWFDKCSGDNVCPKLAVRKNVS